MEFLKISDRHLKICLSAEELKSYIKKEKGEEKLELDAILAAVGLHTGIDLSKEVYIKYYPAPDGSAELFVTLEKEEKSLVCQKKKGVFLVDSKEDFEKLLFHLQKRNILTGEVYRDLSKYYLIMEDWTLQTELLLLEFGSKIKDFSPHYVREHFKKLKE